MLHPSLESVPFDRRRNRRSDGPSDPTSGLGPPSPLFPYETPSPTQTSRVKIYRNFRPFVKIPVFSPNGVFHILRFPLPAFANVLAVSFHSQYFSLRSGGPTDPAASASPLGFSPPPSLFKPGFFLTVSSGAALLASTPLCARVARIFAHPRRRLSDHTRLPVPALDVLTTGFLSHDAIFRAHRILGASLPTAGHLGLPHLKFRGGFPGGL